MFVETKSNSDTARRSPFEADVVSTSTITRRITNKQESHPEMIRKNFLRLRNSQFSDSNERGVACSLSTCECPISYKGGKASFQILVSRTDLPVKRRSSRGKG